MGRLPILTVDQMDEAQLEVYRSITSGARGKLGGPFAPLLHSPALASRVEQLGVYIRYNSTIPERQREMVICVIGSHWRADYEWHAHARLAEKKGISKAILEKIAKGEDVAFEDVEDAVVYQFARELLKTNKVSDGTYGRLVETFGDEGAVDLTGLIGYYTLLAMTLNTFEVEVPEGSDIPWAR